MKKFIKIGNTIFNKKKIQNISYIDVHGFYRIVVMMCGLKYYPITLESKSDAETTLFKIYHELNETNSNFLINEDDI